MAQRKWKCLVSLPATSPFPSEVSVRVVRRSASEPWPEQCSCHLKRAHSPRASGIQPSHWSEPHILNPWRGNDSDETWASFHKLPHPLSVKFEFCTVWPINLPGHWHDPWLKRGWGWGPGGILSGWPPLGCPPKAPLGGTNSLEGGESSLGPTGRAGLTWDLGPSLLLLLRMSSFSPLSSKETMKSLPKLFS